MDCKDYNMINNSYIEYLAENLDKNIEYANYISENLDNTISYTEYLAEALDPNSTNNKKKMISREESINKIFNID